MHLNGFALLYNSGEQDSFGGDSFICRIFLESFLTDFIGGFYPWPIAGIRSPVQRFLAWFFYVIDFLPVGGPNYKSDSR